MSLQSDIRLVRIRTMQFKRELKRELFRLPLIGSLFRFVLGE